jgi:hypothetical protein
MRAFVSSLAFIALGAGLSGCGGGAGGGDVKLANAGGTVTYKGSPVAGASVTFVPENGPIASATTDLQGKFKLSTGALPGAAIGVCKVSVYALEGGGSAAPAAAPTAMTSQPKTPEEGKARMEEMKKSMMAGGSAGAAAPKSVTPAKYANPETSGLSYTIDADASKNDFNITLTD